jgi:hypothetical protein
MRAGTVGTVCGVFALLLAVAARAPADDDAAELAETLQKKIEKALKKADEQAAEAEE